jgi:hypothetical protein
MLRDDEGCESWEVERWEVERWEVGRWEKLWKGKSSGEGSRREREVYISAEPGNCRVAGFMFGSWLNCLSLKGNSRMRWRMSVYLGQLPLDRLSWLCPLVERLGEQNATKARQSTERGESRR